MADNTRVNELQDKLLKAMDILNAQALNSISFDKTITCTIETDKDKKEGKYEVNDGNRIFTAYSSDTRLRSGDVVYVTIPGGNFENQKMIIGKKTTENDKPFVFQMPFDTFFDMTGNLAVEEFSQEELIANDVVVFQDDNGNDITLPKEDCFTSKQIFNKTFDSAEDLIGYTRLAIRADFKSWVKNAISGNYGLLITLKTTKPNTIDETSKDGAYTYLLDSSGMYGNPYNFETYYSQEIVLDLEKQDIGQITQITIDFYQNANFYDKYGKPIFSHEQGFETEELNINVYNKFYPSNVENKNGYYISKGAKLTPNLFVDNLEVYLGYDISTFGSDMVEIYTTNTDTYKRSTSANKETAEQEVDANKKEIKIRWVHIKDGVPIDMNIEKNRKDVNYEIRWYRYHVGVAADDEYCGVYWETDIENITISDNRFKALFNPDVNKQQEKIKVIILCNNIPYHSNEIIFENEEQLPPSEEAQHIASALNIVCDDGTKGNYFLYGQGCRIKDQSHVNKERTLSCYFDTNNDGTHESLIQDSNAITWVFPNKNTMIEPIGLNLTEEEAQANQIRIKQAQPKYRIAAIYNSRYSNNTIQCIYELNGVVYTTEIDLTFGKVGTMGSDQTLVIDFVGDTIAYTIGEQKAKFEIQLFDTSGVLQQIPEGAVKWEWYYNEDEENKIINDKGNSILELSNLQFNIEKLYILQASIGTLTTYFSIPIRKNSDYNYIDGPTEVIYRSDGKPDYSDLSYKLYGPNGEITGNNVEWSIIPSNEAWGYKYVGTITENQFLEENKIYCTRIENYDGTKFVGYSYTEQPKQKDKYNSTTIYYEKIIDNFIGSINDNNKLEPVSIYIKDAPIYGIKAKDGGNTVWSQPIFVCQNQYPSTVINQWDGKSLVLDEENSAIIAAAVSAGRKNSDNTFSGVMMGDWSDSDLDTDESISKQTGLYGFHHGAMSYAFKEDGTAFLGKDGKGRIYIDGNDATIYSTNWTIQGMMIDLNDPYIQLNGTYDGERGNINLSAKPNTQYPLEIGSKFKVKWDGTIYATNGNFTGIISASTLQSGAGGITLNGHFNVPTNSSNIAGYLGFVESNISGATEDAPGIGMSISNGGIASVMKVTTANAGFNYNTHNYCHASASGVQMGSAGGSIVEVVNQNGADKPYVALRNGDAYLTIQDGKLYTNISAANQSGIYARFA